MGDIKDRFCGFGTPRVFAFVNKNNEIRENSSSGGGFFALAENIIKEGGSVYGAAFDENYDVEHVRCTCIFELSKVMTSKYVQSSIGYSFRQAKIDLENGMKVMFSGTPCQIEGLISYFIVSGINEVLWNNILLVDILCYGVPSRLLWRKHIEKIANNRDITNINFRAKTAGKGLKTLQMEFNEGAPYVSTYEKDSYYKAFSDKLSLRQSCFNCYAKNKRRRADISIGDFWGIENSCPELDYENGVTAMIAHNERALEVINNLSANNLIIESSMDELLKYNPYFNNSVVLNKKERERFFASEI